MPCSPSLLKVLTCIFSFCFIVSLCVFICWTVFHFFSELTDSIVKFLKLFIPKWDVISSFASGYTFCGCSEDCCCKQFYLVVQVLLTQVQMFPVLINPSWWTHRPTYRLSQCSTTGVTEAIAYDILSVGWCI